VDVQCCGQSQISAFFPTAPQQHHEPLPPLPSLLLAQQLRPQELWQQQHEKEQVFDVEQDEQQQQQQQQQQEQQHKEQQQQEQHKEQREQQQQHEREARLWGDRDSLAGAPCANHDGPRHSNTAPWVDGLADALDGGDSSSTLAGRDDTPSSVESVGGLCGPALGKHGWDFAGHEQHMGGFLFDGAQDSASLASSGEDCSDGSDAAWCTVGEDGAPCPPPPLSWGGASHRADPSACSSARPAGASSPEGEAAARGAPRWRPLGAPAVPGGAGPHVDLPPRSVAFRAAAAAAHRARSGAAEPAACQLPGAQGAAPADAAAPSPAAGAARRREALASLSEVHAQLSGKVRLLQSLAPRLCGAHGASAGDALTAAAVAAAAAALAAAGTRAAGEVAAGAHGAGGGRGGGDGGGAAVDAHARLQRDLVERMEAIRRQLSGICGNMLAGASPADGAAAAQAGCATEGVRARPRGEASWGSMSEPDLLGRAD
jgi:hypothetical protein